MSRQKELEYHFLEDKPAESDEELEKLCFGHKEIGNTLIKMVINCPTPFTIGLFGKWGSGKSCIANFLRESLSKEKIPVIIFDVWKHKEDSLRRTFLKDCVSQLKNSNNEIFFDRNFTLDDRLEGSVIEGHDNITPNWKFISDHLEYFVLGMPFMIAAYFSRKFENIKDLIGMLAGSSVFTLVLMNTIFKVKTRSSTIDKIGDPYDFEEQFTKILKDGLRAKKILVIFDNLDRVTHDKALEVLTTIKTFLEPKDNEIKKKEVVFLIPCDADAIRDHVKNLFKVCNRENTEDSESEESSIWDADEFLRKFFNTEIRIPKFLTLELDAFIKTQLQETHIPVFQKNDPLQRIINLMFKDNPREIKQFINTFISYYLLAKEREACGDIDKGFIKKNLLFITKLLVIRQKFPNIYKNIENMALWEGMGWKEISSNETLVKKLTKEEDKKIFNLLLKDQEWIKPATDDISVFFTLKRSLEEKALPWWDQFVAAAINQEDEKAIKFMRKLKS